MSSFSQATGFFSSQTVKSFLVSFAALLSMTVSGQSLPIPALDSTLHVLHRQSMFNGTVLLAREGRVIYSKSMGATAPDMSEPITSSTAFNLASVSKQFIALLILQLKEQNKLGYDDPVRKFIPGFPYPDITVRHLLTHTSGLPDYQVIVQQHTNTLDTLSNDDFLDLLADIRPEPLFAPGEKWKYGTTGYVLLVSLIEKITGMSFGDVLEQQIVRPLDLKNTFACALDVRYTHARTRSRALGFERKYGNYVLNDLTRFDGVVGVGGIYSCAEDLLTWDQALYTGKLASTAALRELFSPGKLNDGTPVNYGFGWFVDSTSRKVYHTGSWLGFKNLIERYPDSKTTVILLSNSTDGTARDAVRALLNGKSPQIPHSQLIRNVQLIDGTGTAPRREDVRLTDDRIRELGQLTPFPGEQVTEGNGRVLAPGFIDAHSHHFGGLDAHPEAIPSLNQGVTTIVIGQDGNSYPLDTLQHFMDYHKAAVNIASYTGHSTLREQVMGPENLFRTATPTEVERMKSILQAEMEKGSLGLNTGLEYEEAFYSSRSEVLELAAVAARSGGRYMSHIRSEDINMNDAVEEILDIGRKTGIPVQISHIKIAKRDQWKTSLLLLERLQAARAEGIDVTADIYPYNFWNSTLRVLFPNRDYTNPASAEFAVNQLFDPEQSIVVRFAPNREYAGKTLSDIARLRQQKPAQTLIDLIALAEEFGKNNPDYPDGIEAIMGKSMDDFDVSNMMLWPHTCFCSDGASGGHPRGHGAFTRVLGRYVREQKLMPLETAVYKMTGLTADQVGLPQRGVIMPGNYADLVLFDPETVIDNASVKDGKALSDGIDKVWVNGQTVYESKKSTGELPGVLIRRKQ
ncbi:MAG: serine hydrolase [Bacteroidota bacterium]|jgi:N-acyl-D-amino-acid deacylase